MRILSSKDAKNERKANQASEFDRVQSLRFEGLQPFIRRIPKDAFLTRPKLSTLQLNVTRKCNLLCKHCHVEAGPARREEMLDEVAEAALKIFEREPFEWLDITGGAPEMYSRFRSFLRRATAIARSKGARVVVRSNLAILQYPAFQDLMDLYAELGTEIVCSLPYFTEEGTDRQRGEGVYQSSIAILRELNARGYGKGLPLNLVYNPGGAVLPGSQANLETLYRERLRMEYGIVFDHLLTMTNQPIGRFALWLAEKGLLKAYLRRLEEAFNPCVADLMMCRDTLSVDWDGTLYDCDFNLALKRPVLGSRRRIQHFVDRPLERRSIRYGNHCYACTAGAGSS